jgi:hypothetical protein
MHDDDWVYYAARADQEDEAARKASRPEAAHIHRILANRYRTKASERNWLAGTQTSSRLNATAFRLCK